MLSLIYIIFIILYICRAVTESINHLIDVCTVSSPGQKECDNALRRIQVNDKGREDGANEKLKRGNIMRGETVRKIMNHSTDYHVITSTHLGEFFPKKICY